MKCAWQAYINLLPHWMRQDVDMLGRDMLQELRIREGQTPEMCLHNKFHRLSTVAKKEDISFIINTASEYSPWSARTMAQGFLTAVGGHRIGVCGNATVSDGRVYGISQATSLCIRVARDYFDVAKRIADYQDSILIIGPPCSGKTTMLRDLIRQKSNFGQGFVGVVDERQEIFPIYKGQFCFSAGDRTDILSGAPKSEGIEAILRSMNPSWIAVDEITAEEDCRAILHAGWCGVNLLATAHAGSIQDLRNRPVYRPLLESKLFSNILVLRKDKSWTMERITL